MSTAGESHWRTTRERWHFCCLVIYLFVGTSKLTQRNHFMFVINTNKLHYHLHPIICKQTDFCHLLFISKQNLPFSAKITASDFPPYACCHVICARIHQTDSRYFIQAKWSTGVFGQFLQLPWQQEFYRGTGLWLDTFHFAFTNQWLRLRPIRLSLLCSVVVMQ